MKKLFYPFFLIAIVIGITSCDNETVKLQDITAITGSEPYRRFIYIDDELADNTYAKNVSFRVLDTISKYNEEIYEADMEMLLPEFKRSSMDELVFSRMTFHIRAKATEESITFSGDEIHPLGEVKYTVEGYFKQGLSYGMDTLCAHVKRISPKASFAGNTYELTFNENTFNYSDFSDNGYINNRPIIEYAQEGIPYYTKFQHDKTNGAIYHLTFQENGVLNIKKKDNSMSEFEPVAKDFKYYIITKDSNKGTGMITMSFDTASELEYFLQGGFLHGGWYYYNYANPFLVTSSFELPFQYMENNEGMLMIALGDKAYPQYKIKTMINTWMHHLSEGYYTPGEIDPLKIFLTNWNIEINNLADNLWWNLKKK